jgi:hypothetical protein
VKTLRLGNSIVLDPESGPTSAVVVYGGLYGWEGEWLVPEIPVYLRSSAIFVLPRHFTNDCNACLKELHTKISPENITSYSLCGYSRGGVEVYRYRNLAQWKILGLIDPSAPTMGGFPETVLDSVSHKIRCVYWVPNWGKDGYGGRIPSFANHLRDLKVKMKEQATEHRYMPSLFFAAFRSDLLG